MRSPAPVEDASAEREDALAPKESADDAGHLESGDAEQQRGDETIVATAAEQMPAAELELGPSSYPVLLARARGSRLRRLPASATNALRRGAGARRRFCSAGCRSGPSRCGGKSPSRCSPTSTSLRRPNIRMKKKSGRRLTIPFCPPPNPTLRQPTRPMLPFVGFARVLRRRMSHRHASAGFAAGSRLRPEPSRSARSLPSRLTFSFK